MEETYKGYTIRYSEVVGTFTAEIGQSSHSNRSLDKVKKHIDNLDRKDFKRITVIFTIWGGENYNFGTVTSEIPEANEVWISYKDEYHNATRTKQLRANVFVDNPHNKAILDQITQKKTERETLTKEIRALRGNFDRYKLEVDR